MKKVLSTVAALGLVAGLASTAAAVEFKMSGKYIVEGYSISDANTTYGADLAGPTSSDAYWMHTLQIKPTMKVNDKISMHGDVRIFKEAVWGDPDSGVSQDDGNTDLDFDKVWMTYLSPIGEFRVGRHEANIFGSKFLDSSTSADRIMWFPSFVPKPWSLLVLTQKNEEDDLEANAADQDDDLYKLMITHTSDAGKAGVEYKYTRSASAATLDGTGEPNSLDAHNLALWGKYKVMDNWTIEAEVNHRFGDQSNAEGTTTVTDWDAWAGMLDVTGKFGALDAGLMYFYASGDSNSLDGDNEAAMSAYGGTGDDFKPLYILTSDHTGILNDDLADFTDAQYAGVAAAGVHAVVLHAKYAVSDKLTLMGAIGYAQADEETQVTNAAGTNFSGGGYANRDDEFGWEYNIGAAYKLLDNLTYEAHFGYLDTGDFFKSAVATDDTNNITLMSHHLTMSF
ncbi:MAG: hypothetical protein KKE83_08125 [Proteobacteria bacterium]|nr:hypothetical protein [Pseudomonadota bacterium]MBU1545311.1 hypothetical protein [Pseudomonadota bacterium]MBU2619638.1 hypothetical protein [Pseudomonadota bacterium]